MRSRASNLALFSLRLSRLTVLILFVLHCPDCFFGLMFRRPISLQSVAKRRQFFGHISVQIIFHFSLVNNKNFAALRRKSGFEVFKAKPDQSISMRNNDNLGWIVPE